MVEKKTIIINQDALQEIIHDAIGDTPRQDLGLEGHGAEIIPILEPIQYGEGSVVDVEDLPGLERRIMNAVVECSTMLHTVY